MLLFDLDTMNDNVLNKLLSVKADKTAVATKRLPDEDIAYCERITQLYEDAHAQLDRWEMMFKTDLVENWKDMYNFTDYENGNISYSLDYERTTRRETFAHDIFFPGEALESIHKSRKGVHSRYIGYLRSYFSGKYNLSLHEYDYRDCTTFEEFISTMFEEIGVTNLVDFGRDKLITDFKKMCGDDVQVKSLTIDINRDRNILDADYDRVVYTFEGERYSLLTQAINFYETGDITGHYQGQIIHRDTIGNIAKRASTHKHIDHDWSTKFSMGEKLTHIKFYKNGRITLYFDSPEHTAQFYTLFQFDRVQQEQH